jgi:hypothetical protein
VTKAGHKNFNGTKNITTDCEEMGCGYVKWLELAQD